MPYGECVNRAGCLFSVSKRTDEIPKYIQHLVPVSGPLLPISHYKLLCAEEVWECSCFAGWHIPKAWSLLRSALSGSAWLGQRVKLTNDLLWRSFQTPSPFYFVFAFSGWFWQLADREKGRLSGLLLSLSNTISPMFLNISLFWSFIKDQNPPRTACTMHQPSK